VKAAPGVGGRRGISSGAKQVAARSVAGRLGADATVATVICDSGLRFLGTGLR